MKIRAVAAAALALALGLGMTGCNMISPQRTQMEYDPSDGVGLEISDGVHVENAMLLTDDGGERANLILTGVNFTASEATLTVDVGDSSVEISLEPRGENVPNSITDVGYGEQGEEIVTGDFQTGSTINTTFTATYTDAEGQTQTESVEVPLPILGSDDLENVLPEYRTLLPETPTPTPEETPSETFEEVIEDDIVEEEGFTPDEPVDPAEPAEEDTTP